MLSESFLAEFNMSSWLVANLPNIRVNPKNPSYYMKSGKLASEYFRVRSPLKKNQQKSHKIGWKNIFFKKKLEKLLLKIVASEILNTDWKFIYSPREPGTKSTTSESRILSQ